VGVGGDQASAFARLPALPSSVGAARRLVRGALPQAGFDDLVEAAELVVSEAVTNAVVHTGTSIDVTVMFTGAGARLEVRDGSKHHPTPRDYAATAGTGRGLLLIDGLTTSWGTVPHSDGKTVWFELDAHPADPPFGAGALPGPSPAPANESIEAAAPAGELPTSAAPSLPAHVDQEAPISRDRTEHGSFEVELPQFPVLLYIAWREYAETLLRDFLLAGLDRDDDEEAVRVHAESSQALALLAEHITTPTLADDPTQLLADAAAPELTTARVRIKLPRQFSMLFVTLDRTMEAAGEMSELATSLAAPIQPEMRQFRRWLCGEVARQADGHRPVAWSPDPNHVRLPPRAFDPVAWDLAQLTTAGGAFVAVDDANGIVAVSESAAELLGYDTAEALVGHRLVWIIPERYRQAHVAGFTLHLLDGRDVLLDTPVVLPLRRRDGTESSATVTISKHRTEDGRAVFVAAIDQLPAQ